jgi:hypothetical protein
MLDHILQVCARGWVARMQAITTPFELKFVQSVNKKKTKKNRQVIAEPNIPAGNGMLEPDLGIFNATHAYVVDVST